MASNLNMVATDADGAARGFLEVLRNRTKDLRTAGRLLRRTEQVTALAGAVQAIMAVPNLCETPQAITDASRLIVGEGGDLPPDRRS